MCCNNGLEPNTFKFIHVAENGETTTKEFQDKFFIDKNIKEFVYFLQGLGYATETIEKYIPYFE